MITEHLYQKYFDFLLNGKRKECSKIVQYLLDQDINIQILYIDLFQKSLYEVGELWEYNKISVAKEHLVTAITEGLINLVYPKLFENETALINKSVVISCSANEFHQIGGKMVADIFELHGWDSHFLGANTPVNNMLEYIQDKKPDLVGLSVSVFFNMTSLKTGIEAVKSNFPNMDIFVGGQAFNWVGNEIIKNFTNTDYIPSIQELSTALI